jgi:hypothetical protein
MIGAGPWLPVRVAVPPDPRDADTMRAKDVASEIVSAHN